MTTTMPEATSEGLRGLKGKNVLVTGGSSGIGQAIAVRFADYGANVAINYLRQPEEAAETEEKVHACLASVRQTGVQDVLVQGDVSKEEDVVCMFEDAVDKLSGVHGGMQNLTRTLAPEYAGHNIRVNAIGPGATVTPINRAWIEDPVKREMVESHIPMARAGTADEMAGVTCFLASDDAGYITGQTIYVDGGLSLFADFREPWSSE